MIRAALVLVMVLSGAAVMAEPPAPSPVAAFLTAADNGDEPAMLALLGKSSLPGVLKGCYLRRVYGNSTTGEVLAAWMCAQGDKASRVVIGSVTGAGDKVKLTIARETSNKIPAPPRTGTALAPEPKPAPEAAK